MIGNSLKGHEDNSAEFRTIEQTRASSGPQLNQSLSTLADAELTCADSDTDHTLAARAEPGKEEVRP